jgi:hypothetical protein
MKYCPLCAAEYRDTTSSCTACGGAELVESLTAARNNSSRLLWEGTDRQEFDSVVGGIRDSEIPADVQGERIGILGKLASGQFRIRVLQADFERALQLAALAASNQRKRAAPKRSCHVCLAECSASLAACTQCKITLKVDHKKDVNVSLQDALPPTAMKYCPLCDAEYNQSYERCSVCGVELVPEELRGRPLDDRQRNEKIQVVWRSGDPTAVSEVISTLREPGIRHHVQPTNEHLVFELGMPRPKYAVRVFASDVAKAKALLADIRETAPFALTNSDEATEGPDERIEPRRAQHEWNPVAAITEIWGGHDPALAELLEACLRENRIGVRCEGAEPGALQLAVMPADEAAAREIVREVREATPPA